jgi:hypothetical protein
MIILCTGLLVMDPVFLRFALPTSHAVQSGGVQMCWISKINQSRIRLHLKLHLRLHLNMEYRIQSQTRPTITNETRNHK